MQQLASYLSGTWQTGRGHARTIHHAISGDALWEVTSAGLDMAQARRFAIERGGKALQAMTFIERSAMLKAVAKHLLELKADFYAISAETGATLSQIALAWVTAQPGVTAPIASATSTAQLDEIMASETLVLTDEQLAALTTAGA